MALASSADAAYEDRTSEGRRRLSYAIGLASPTPRSPGRIPRRAPNFTRKLVKSGFGGEVYAFSVMVGRMAAPREYPPPFVDLSPGMVRLGRCECLVTRLQDRETVDENYLARHFLGCNHPWIASSWLTFSRFRAPKVQRVAPRRRNAQLLGIYPATVKIPES